jgi:tRNA threonylcarbamoyladenosine biosynthesis protein TsaB
MGECYVGFYQKRSGIAQALAPECLLKPEAITLPFDGEWIGAGTAFAPYEQQLLPAFTGALQRIDAAVLPQPEALLQLATYGFNTGLARAPEHIEPTYLRDKVALTIAERAGA